MNRNPNDPSTGLDVNKFMKLVGISLTVLLVGMLVLTVISGKTLMRRIDHPKPTTAASPQ